MGPVLIPSHILRALHAWARHRVGRDTLILAVQMALLDDLGSDPFSIPVDRAVGIVDGYLADFYEEGA